jgi:r-opsin
MSGYGYAYRANASVVDLVPKDMLFMVPEHWYKYPPINPLWHSLLGLVMILLGIVSMIGNGVVIYLMTTVKSLRTPTNMLICNLAVSDFLMMATNAPTMARELLHRPVYEKRREPFSRFLLQS